MQVKGRRRHRPSLTSTQPPFGVGQVPRGRAWKATLNSCVRLGNWDRNSRSARTPRRRSNCRAYDVLVASPQPAHSFRFEQPLFTASLFPEARLVSPAVSESWPMLWPTMPRLLMRLSTIIIKPAHRVMSQPRNASDLPLKISILHPCNLNDNNYCSY